MRFDGIFLSASLSIDLFLLLVERFLLRIFILLDALLFGTGGFIRFDRDGWRLEARTGDGIVLGQGASEKNFSGMYAAFEQALRTRQLGDLASGEDGRVAVKISRDATERLQRGKDA